MAEPIGVKITRADKRGRKIILVLESDLYSHETFAVNPFYNEGDVKNQLQDIHFNIEVTETKGTVKAKVAFGNCLGHFTRGHSQIHEPLASHYLDRKDMALNWVRTTQVKWFTEDKIDTLLNHWIQEDEEFYHELLKEIKLRKEVIRETQMAKAEEKMLDAIEEVKGLMLVKEI